QGGVSMTNYSVMPAERARGDLQLLGYVIASGRFSISGVSTRAGPVYLFNSYVCSPRRYPIVPLRTALNAYAIESSYASRYSTPYLSPSDPYGGYLRGAADVITSCGECQLSTRRAELVAEVASQTRLETRRREFDEWLYNRDNRPTREDDRERVQ